MGTSTIKKLNPVFFGLAVMAILLCFSSQVQAAQEGDYTYAITDGQAQITEYLGTGGEVAVPTTLGGVPVTSIGDQAFSDCLGLKKITVPEGVTSIGEGAFSGCKSLTDVKLPESLTSIGDVAFADCTGLKSITIPKNAALMGEDTFKGCTNLTNIWFGTTKPTTIYEQAYRRIMTATDGYSKITATITLPTRDKAEDLNITSNSGAASYNYFGCQRKENDGSGFDFEFGFGFKPCENNMMQFGMYYSLKANTGDEEIKDWRWVRPGTGGTKFYSFDYGTTHQVQLEAYDGKIKAVVRDENNNLEYSGSWSFTGPVENGDHQIVRRVTSLLVPADEAATAKNYQWMSTDVGESSTLKAANPLNCKATISTSGDSGWITVVTGAEYNQEKISFDID